MSQDMTKKEIIEIMSQSNLYLRNTFDGKVYKPVVGDDFLKLVEGGFPLIARGNERDFIDLEYQDVYHLPSPMSIMVPASSLGCPEWAPADHKVELQFLFHLSINDIYSLDYLNAILDLKC